MFSEVSGKGKSISPTINGILGLYSRSHCESNASYFINLNDTPFKFKNNIFASAEILLSCLSDIATILIGNETLLLRAIWKASKIWGLTDRWIITEKNCYFLYHLPVTRSPLLHWGRFNQLILITPFLEGELHITPKLRISYLEAFSFYV